MRKFPMAFPDLSEAESSRVSDAIASSWISSTGRYLEEFESSFAESCRVPHAVAVANGTVALHLILAALGIGPGDEVIVPSLTYVANANCVRYVGADPIFADVSPNTWCLDPAHVESLVTSRTAAIVAVHLFGHPADMAPLTQIAARTGVALIEDAAEAPFATYYGRPTGGLGLAASFSFYGNKIITSGEGGAVTTGDSELASRLRLLRGQGMDPDRRYFFPVIGYNFRLTNVAAAILCGQMSRKACLLDRRQKLFDAYETALQEDDRIELQPVATWATRAPWTFTLLLNREGASKRDALMAVLAEAGVETRPMFVPVHTLPPYRQSKSTPLPITDDLGQRGLSLPTSSVMSAEDAKEIARRLTEALDGL